MLSGLRHGDLIPRPLAVAVLAVALFLRLVIPTGWMPMVDGAGAMRVTLCSGMGRTTVWVDADGKIHQQNPDDAGQVDQPCAFAGIAMAADVPPPIAAGPLAPAAALAVAIGLRMVVTIGQGLAAPPPPPTGPPAFA